MNVKRMIVAGLNTACTLVDEVAYRPAVVKLTMPLPRWWRCDLGRLSVWLDERWQTGVWGDWAGPVNLCECCGRRATWLVRGGYGNDPEFEDDPPSADDFMAWRMINLCRWCRLPDGDIISEEELEKAFAQARRDSIAWRWHMPRK